MSLAKLLEHLTVLSPEGMADLIRDRLFGGELGAPYDPTRGEQPEDIFLDLFHSQISIPPPDIIHRYHEALNYLADTFVSPMIMDLTHKQFALDPVDALWLQRFFRLVASSNLEFEDHLYGWLAATSYARTRSDELRALFLGLVDAFLIHCDNCVNIVPVLIQALEDPSLRADISILLAKADPEQFCTYILPRYLSQILKELETTAALDSHGQTVQSAMDRFSTTLRAVLEGVTSDAGKSRAIADGLILAIPQYADHAQFGLAVRCAILKAASLSRFSAEHTLRIDDEYWKAQTEPELISRRTSPLWGWVESRVQRLYGQTLRRKRDRQVLCMNLIPYTEHAFLLLYKGVLDVAANIELSFVDCGWNPKGVQYALTTDQIQVAVYNKLLEREFEPGTLAGPRWPIFKFQGYHVYIGTDWLRRLATSEPGGRVANVASSLLAGAAWPEDLSDEDRALILRGARITAPEFSDLERAIRDACEGIGLVEERDIQILGYPVKECLHRFLDGEVEGICAGGNDSEFLRNGFAMRVRRVASIPTVTDDYLYVRKQFHDSGDNAMLLETMLALWDVTVDLWEHIQAGEEGVALEDIEEHMILGVNSVTPGGNLSDFSELQRVVVRHDVLIKRPPYGGAERMHSVRAL